MIYRGNLDALQIFVGATWLVTIVAIRVDAGTQHFECSFRFADSDLQHLNRVTQLVKPQLISNHLSGKRRGINGDSLSAHAGTSQTEQTEICSYIEQEHSWMAMREELRELCRLLRTAIAEMSRQSSFVCPRMTKKTISLRNCQLLIQSKFESGAIPKPC